METVIQNLVKLWKESTPSDFAQQARKAIIAYNPSEKVSTKDPKRLGVLAVTLSKLKTECLKCDHNDPLMNGDIDKLEEKYGVDHPDWDEWDNSLDLVAKVKLQRQYRKTNATGLRGELAEVRVIPLELQALCLNPEERRMRNFLDSKRMDKKLAEAKDFEVDKMLELGAPGLSSQWFNDVIPALLLTTGRRTIEIMKTGKFEPVSEYRVRFSGQAKKGDLPDKPYEIDILAPAPMVIRALEWVRDKYDCKAMSSSECNQKWGKLVGVAVAKKFFTTPHRLRGVNAVACERIYNVGDKKKSFMGYLKDHLGHANPSSVASYQCLNAKIAKAWSDPNEEKKEEKGRSANRGEGGEGRSTKLWFSIMVEAIEEEG